MDELSAINSWLAERKIGLVETIVSDMAGLPRGKLLPFSRIEPVNFKLPLAVFCQTIEGKYYIARDNVVDRDMTMRPDPSTLRVIPWTSEPAAAVLMDCFHAEGGAVEFAPRQVLKRILGKFEERGWFPVVAPEIEFYLTRPGAEAYGDEGSAHSADSPLMTDPYGVDRVQDIADFTRELTEHCCVQEIPMGTILQELGPGQFEVNLEHGHPLKLADDVFHLKRTIKRTARAHGMIATFLAKIDSDEPGSSMHIHQSVYDADGNNVFSATDGQSTDLFAGFLGGVQRYVPDVLLLLAPYANSYRRFTNPYSSPVNLEWGMDNRTVGLRVPNSPPDARRVENRLPGSDVNPYLAIAAALACGLAGMTAGLSPRSPVEGSAYKVPFALHRHLYEALDALRRSAEMRDLLGEEFVSVYSAVKEVEYRNMQQRIPEWERGTMRITV